MPNLPMHLFLANRIAEDLDWGSVHDNLGDYLLGSTAPDIRAMTKWDRARTHFAPLSLEQIGQGTRNMFDIYPGLIQSTSMNAASRAFLIGYITHLTADEVWITTMYRPNFESATKVTDTKIAADIWDRALQLDMDKGVLEESNHLARQLNFIKEGDQTIELEFLEQELLLEWRSWVSRFMGWNFSWDRLRRALNRMYRDDQAVQVLVGEFLTNIESNLETVYDKIPKNNITAFQERVATESLKQIKEYIRET